MAAQGTSSGFEAGASRSRCLNGEIEALGAQPPERFLTFDSHGYKQDLMTGQPGATVSRGLNRFVWDMRYPSVPAIPGVPLVLIKPIAKQGTNLVRLTVDGESETQSFELKMNPNETYTREQIDEKGAFWLALHAKATEGVQAVLDAQAAQARVAEVLEADNASEELEAQAEAVHDVSQEFIASMVATGSTPVQIISVPTKPLAKLATLQNVMESTEGQPNQPLRAVYAKTADEIDAAIAEFRRTLDQEMTKFVSLSGR